MLSSYWPIFIIVLVVSVTEALLRTTWNLSYFRWGIPIHIKKIRCQNCSTIFPQAHDIEAAIPKSDWATNILIHNIDNNIFAFRGEFTFNQRKRNGMPFPHGTLQLNPSTNKLTATGYLSWTCLLIALITIYIFIYQLITNGTEHLLFPFFLGGLLFFTLASENKRFNLAFNALAKVADNQWSETEFS